VIVTIIGGCSVFLIINFFWMKRLYLRQWPAVGDVLGWICAPVSTIIYIYCPILIAQTILFWQDNLEYKVTDKPLSTSFDSALVLGNLKKIHPSAEVAGLSPQSPPLLACPSGADA
jgi:hypothetical protein